MSLRSYWQVFRSWLGLLVGSSLVAILYLCQHIYWQSREEGDDGKRRQSHGGLPASVEETYRWALSSWWSGSVKTQQHQGVIVQTSLVPHCGLETSVAMKQQAKVLFWEQCNLQPCVCRVCVRMCVFPRWVKVPQCVLCWSDNEWAGSIGC